MKTCTKCHTERIETMFYRRSDNKAKRHATCKICMNTANAKYQRRTKRGIIGIKYHIRDETLADLAKIFEQATQCPFEITDVDMAIRILLRK